jgi:hypothetical protein
MDWKKPEFEEISMNAEIGSYQEDDGGRYPVRPEIVRLDAMPGDEASLAQGPADA